MASLVAILFFLQAGDELYRQGLLLLRQNDAAGAVAVFEKAAQQEPSAPLIWMALADARLRLRNFAGASAAESKAVTLAGSDPVVRKARSMFHARFARIVPDPKDASSHWKLAQSLDPKTERYRLEYIQFLLDRRADREAEQEVRGALVEFPNNPELHRFLGLALYAQGRNPEAIEAFLSAIDLSPDNEAYYASLETLVPFPGPQVTAIVKRLNSFRGTHPQSPLAPYLQAFCLPERKAELLSLAVSNDPNFWPAYFELHKLTPEIGEQIRLLEKVVELNAEYSPAYYALGQAYAKAGRREDARKAREKHHTLQRNSP